MKNAVRIGWLVWMLAVSAGVLGLTGCATNSDPEGLSQRPWNTPKNWESGLPSGMNQGR